MHATISTIKQVIRSGVPLLLEGPTGTGKTHMVMELARQEGKELTVINVSGELTVDMLLGRDTLTDGSVRYVKAKFVDALEKGNWVLADELNTALPEVLTVINGVLDDSRSVTLPDAENTRVTAHPDFRFIATQNPASGEYAGTARLNTALLNRMVRMTVDYLDFESEVEALRSHTKLKDSSIVQLVRLAQFTRNEMDDHLSTRDLVKILRLKEAGGMSLRDAIKTVALTRYSRDDYNRIYGVHASIMSELDDIGALNTDPFELIKSRMNELREKEQALNEEKRDLREAVRKEILTDLLTSKGGAAATTTNVPKDF